MEVKLAFPQSLCPLVGLKLAFPLRVMNSGVDHLYFPSKINPMLYIGLNLISDPMREKPKLIQITLICLFDA